MNQKDDLKHLRLQEEKSFINSDFIEALAFQLINELVLWANKEIFTPRKGELTFKMTLGPPNAGVAIDSNRPFHPRMEFRTSLISEIYADALAFPIICRRLEQETETLKNFNETEKFRACSVQFSSALPELYESNVAKLFSPACETLIRLFEKKSDDPKLQPNEVRCQFIMFELMLVWTFFHELGHIVQGHHIMHSKAPSLISNYSFSELDDTAPVPADHEVLSMTSAAAGKVAAPDLAAQARELMADAEATDQTLKYLVAHNRLNYNVWYLLLCSTGCMFQRFYNNYPANLELSHARHPHPVIRDKASQLLSCNCLVDYLVASNNVQNSDEVEIPLVYLSVRASLMTGLFRSNRIEKRDNENCLPSYMKLISVDLDQQRSYIKTLLPEIELQLPTVLEYHLIKMHSLEYWFALIKADANAAS